jgi:hypothetical protein
MYCYQSNPIDATRLEADETEEMKHDRSFLLTLIRDGYLERESADQYRMLEPLFRAYGFEWPNRSTSAVAVDYFPIGPQAVGIDTIALSEFGGEMTDPVGAALRVDGWPRVFILRPRLEGPGAADINARFEGAVRELARTYEFRGGQSGPVDIVWKPHWQGTATQCDVPGEPVDRVVWRLSV